MRSSNIKITSTKSNTVEEREDLSRKIERPVTEQDGAFSAESCQPALPKRVITEDKFYNPKRDGVRFWDISQETPISIGMRRDELRFDRKAERALLLDKGASLRKRIDSLDNPIDPSKLKRRANPNSSLQTLTHSEVQQPNETEIET